MYEIEIIELMPILKRYAERLCNNGYIDPDDLFGECVCNLIKKHNKGKIRVPMGYIKKAFFNQALNILGRESRNIAKMADYIAQCGKIGSRIEGSGGVIKRISNQLNGQTARVFAELVEEYGNVGRVADKLGMTRQNVRYHRKICRGVYFGILANKI